MFTVGMNIGVSNEFNKSQYKFMMIQIDVNKNDLIHTLIYLSCNCIVYTTEGKITSNRGNQYDVIVGGRYTALTPKTHKDRV